MRLRDVVRATVFVSVAASLAACNASAPPPQAAATQTASVSSKLAPPPDVPSGTACGDTIIKWRAVLDDDVETGNLNQSVYDQIRGDVSSASDACRGGRDAEARTIVASSKKRHGYGSDTRS